MSRPGAVAAMAVLDVAYPRRFPEPSLRMYIDALADLEDDALLTAVQDMVLTSKYPPRVAEIREQVLRSVGATPTTGEAWQEVTETCRTLGRGVIPDWSDPIIRDALNMAGGYVEACNTEYPGGMASRFAKSYEALVEQRRYEMLSDLGRADRPKEIEQ